MLDIILPGWREELPPRARRIRQVCLGVIRQPGTTSACAENTQKSPSPWRRIRNYLRVRGEYLSETAPTLTRLELPPRARRILGVPQYDTGHEGTTSACAENTTPRKFLLALQRNYLRVRGEYYMRPRGINTPRELPPRARRIQLWAAEWGRKSGTTSACAENTLNELGLL